MLLILLPVLLGALATLQYRWLSEISNSERERLHSRLQTDSRRFAQDFNAQITRAFFTFQLDSQSFGSAAKIGERWNDWRSQSAFPNIVSEIYISENQILRRFNPATTTLENAEWTAELAAVREKLNQPAKLIDEQSPLSLHDKIRSAGAVVQSVPALVVPVFTKSAEIQSGKQNVFVRVRANDEAAPQNFVIVKLDAEKIKTEMLPAIFRSNFGESGLQYNFAVVNREQPDNIIFQSAPNISQPDVSTGIFELAPDSTNLLILNRDSLPRLPAGEATVIFKNTEQIQGEPKTKRVEISRSSSRVELNRVSGETSSGFWLLNIQHADGSLENFTGRAKWRSLGLSFGILALLGASVGLLIFSTHRLRRAAQRQIDFVSSVSHEFRTPVAVISSAGENLADGIVRDAAGIEKYGKLIRREASRLNEMVEQILQFAGARSGRSKYAFQSTEIAPVIEEVLKDCESLLEDFVVETHIEKDSPPIKADVRALRQALQNLVSNAAKYSNGSRQIEISAKNESANIVISIADKGIGIAAGELKQIFEPFYRGREVVAAQIHGNGLGLSVVKQIVAAHKGKISVESQPHQGSKFTITLPKDLK